MLADNSTEKLFDLSNQVAIVTGSGRGLGAAIARGLAAAGASVMVCSRTKVEVDRMAADIVQSGGKAAATVVDTSNRESCQRLIDETVARFGRVDVLVNNAGIDVIVPAEDLTDDGWEQVIDTNLKGYFLCSQVAARQMLRQGTGGSIINNSSICSIIGVQGLTVYSAAKGGVNQLTRVMAVEWARRGIRVNAIAPGYFDNVMQGATAEHARSEKQQQVITFTPMGRRGQPEELVGPVVFLASRASSYVTGAVLFVDGGYTAQ
ncbi:MAG: glucose 1-dehydrogenase [Terriglobales bacterium]|jgi:NAD(P)-dependent dehydrogenase (short-subunit alcohol dehydrogenase family)